MGVLEASWAVLELPYGPNCRLGGPPLCGTPINGLRTPIHFGFSRQCTPGNPDNRSMVLLGNGHLLSGTFLPLPSPLFPGDSVSSSRPSSRAVTQPAGPFRPRKNLQNRVVYKFYRSKEAHTCWLPEGGSYTPHHPGDPEFCSPGPTAEGLFSRPWI